MSTHLPLPFGLLILVLSAPVAGNENWPQFRGEHGTGLTGAAILADTWGATENVTWKVTIPGQGWSSPVTWGDRIFLTSFVSDAGVGAPKTGYYAPRDVSIPEGKHRWTVFCLDANTGETVWTKVAHEGRPEHSIHVKASYAAETPVTDGERVYVYFGNVGVFCYDLAGNEVWSHRWKAQPTRLGWGTGASPVLHDGRLYIVNDNEAESFLVCLDAPTGKEIWRVPRDEKSSWATPYTWEHDGRTEIVTTATGKVRSYDLDGKLLWELGGMSSICVPMPVEAHGLLFISSGYEFGKPRPLIAVKPGAHGDISLKAGETSNEFIAWSHDDGGAYHPTPVAYGDYLYVLYSRGLFACFDARTGRDVYGLKRLGGNFTASPWANDGKIYCLSEEGVTSVVKAGPEFEILQTNSLDEVALATPAVTGNAIILRTLTQLYRIEPGGTAGAGAKR